MAQDPSQHRGDPVQKNVGRIRSTAYPSGGNTLSSHEGFTAHPATIPKTSSSISNHTGQLPQHATANHVLALDLLHNY
jgi:hypothetical protein